MKTKLNVFFSSQLKKNVYEIANERKNVDFFFYHGMLEEFVKDKYMINDINSLLKKSDDHRNSEAGKIVFIIIESPLYFDVNSTDEIEGFEAVSKQIMNALNWRENLIFIINNRNVKKVPYSEQIQSLTKEILLDDNVNNDKTDGYLIKNDINLEEKDSPISSLTELENSKLVSKEEISAVKDINNEEIIEKEYIINDEKNNFNEESKNEYEIEYEEISIKKDESYKPKEFIPKKSKTPQYEYIDNNYEKAIEKSKIDYDNIVWMDHKNKHLFEGKEPKTRVVYINQINKNLNKVIEDNSSVDEYMLENNKIKIDME